MNEDWGENSDQYERQPRSQGLFPGFRGGALGTRLYERGIVKDGSLGFTVSLFNDWRVFFLSLFVFFLLAVEFWKWEKK